MFVKLTWNVCKTYVKSPSSGTSHFWMPKGGPPRGRSENKIIICRLWLHFAVTGYLYCSAYCLLFVYEDIFLCLFTKICLVWLVKICQIDEHFHLSIVDHVHLGVVPAWLSRVRFIYFLTNVVSFSTNHTKALVVGHAVLQERPKRPNILKLGCLDWITEVHSGLSWWWSSISS